MNDKERAVFAAALRKKYEAIGMPGAARLVDFFGSKHAHGLLEMGSSSIGPYGQGRLYIGRPHADPPVSPLEDMGHNYEHMLEFSAADRTKIDSVFGAFAAANWSSRKWRSRIPNAFRRRVIEMFRKLGWRVSDEMSLGMKWWWVPFYHKLKRQHELKRAGLA